MAVPGATIAAAPFEVEKSTQLELSVVLPTFKERANVAEMIARLE